MTQLREGFGFDFAKNSYANQPALLRGEQEYKQFINKHAEDNMLNRKVSAVSCGLGFFLSFLVSRVIYPLHSLTTNVLYYTAVQRYRTRP